jgi:hypothetical protein
MREETENKKRLKALAEAYHRYTDTLSGIQDQQKNLLAEINKMISEQNREKAKETFHNVIASL